MENNRGVNQACKSLKKVLNWANGGRSHYKTVFPCVLM